MIDPRTMAMDEVVFSHHDIDGTDRHFNITRLLQRVAQGDIPIVEFPVDHAFAMHAAGHFGLEPHRFNRLTEKALRTPLMFANLQGAELISGMEALLIDGAHRYVWAAVHGIQILRAWMVPEEVWQEYLVDVPEWLNDIVMPEVINQTGKSMIP